MLPIRGPIPTSAGSTIGSPSSPTLFASFEGFTFRIDSRTFSVPVPDLRYILSKLAKVEISFASIVEGTASTISRGRQPNKTVQVLWPRVAVLTNGTKLEPVISMLAAWVAQHISASTTKGAAQCESCNAAVSLSAGPQPIINHVQTRHVDHECILMCHVHNILITRNDTAARHLSCAANLHHWPPSPFRPKLTSLLIESGTAFNSRTSVAMGDAPCLLVCFEIEALQTTHKLYLDTNFNFELSGLLDLAYSYGMDVCSLKPSRLVREALTA